VVLLLLLPVHVARRAQEPEPGRRATIRLQSGFEPVALDERERAHWNVAVGDFLVPALHDERCSGSGVQRGCTSVLRNDDPEDFRIDELARTR
jgi:hypothetical protein